MQSFARSGRNVVDANSGRPCFAAIGGSPREQIAIGGQTVRMFPLRLHFADDSRDDDGSAGYHDARTAMACQRNHLRFGDLHGLGKCLALIGGCRRIDRVPRAINQSGELKEVASCGSRYGVSGAAGGT